MKDVVILKPGVYRYSTVADAVEDFCMNVGDLKRYLKTLDDDTPVVIGDNYMCQPFQPVDDICITMYKDESVEGCQSGNK